MMAKLINIKLISVFITLPIIFIIVATLHFGVHVPFWDQWEMVKLFQARDAGTLSFSDFWAQHNEHRILFPNLVLYGLALLTHWDPYYEVMISLALGILILFTTMLILRRTLKGHKYLLPILSVLAAWLILSPVQYGNWLWGWQVEWFMSIFGVVLTVLSLSTTKMTNKNFLLAIGGATMATYSLGNGAAIWPIGLLLLLLLKASWKKCAAWSVIGVIEVVLYYVNYVNPGYEPSKTLWVEQPINFVRYVLVYLGRPLGFEFRIAHIVGLILLILFFVSCIYLWLLKRHEFEKQVAWFGLGLYALIGASATSASRMGFGIDQAFSSRYTTISTLFTLSTIVITTISLKLYFIDHNNRRILKTIVTTSAVCIIVPLIIISYYEGFRQMQQLNRHLIDVRTCLIAATSPNDQCLLLAYPNSEVVWERLQYLRSIKWGGLGH